MINYNGNFNSDLDNNIGFGDIDLSCNKLSILLLSNNSITNIKKKRIIKTKDKPNEISKVKIT